MPAGVRQLPALQMIGHLEAGQQIGQRNGQQPPVAELVPAQRHEQRHGADGHHAAEVIRARW